MTRMNENRWNQNTCISICISTYKKGIYYSNSSAQTVTTSAGNENNVKCEEKKEMKRGQGKECISFCYLTQY
ncbi:MAG: hypothetical protein BV457_02720 [Thermoplasmata archaeon M9B1D]|nr:MAG: hypothetical protein BV457_02720 [Thermoplasmata archaeon M9B1D]PNX50237.1 MAG: hypothetical protein BV456_07305 [Thermoplasmata archaeon M8B2D]